MQDQLAIVEPASRAQEKGRKCQHSRTRRPSTRSRNSSQESGNLRRRATTCAGIKNSGIGREGPKFAIRDMTDERLVVFNL